MIAKRGRKSTAELSVVAAGEFDQRPPAPSRLTPRQAEIWTETVRSESADFFKTSALQALLSDYCVHRETVETLNATLSTVRISKRPEDLDLYRQLLRLRECEVKSAAQLATKLRMTNQSRYTPHAAATAAKRSTATKKPWEAQ